MKKVLIFAAAVIALTSCGNSTQKNDETTVANDSTAVVEEVGFFGEYEGTLPAADCEGIKTNLVINNDSTYTLKSEYIGIKDGTFETSGVYKMPNDSLLELITPSSGEKTYYRILGNEKVMLSDEKGTINNGELSEYYILTKK